jgi:hypothetical protein
MQHAKSKQGSVPCEQEKEEQEENAQCSRPDQTCLHKHLDQTCFAKQVEANQCLFLSLYDQSHREATNGA